MVQKNNSIMQKQFFIKAAVCLFAGIAIWHGCKSKTVPTEDITLETAVWQLTSILADPVPMQVPDTFPAPITIKFSGGKIEGFGGCNNLGGGYEVNGNQLSVTGIWRTKMYCRERSEWEDNFLQSFERSKSYKIQGETLEIDCGDMAGLMFRLNWKKR
jgi:heat shock protein HslJ